MIAAAGNHIMKGKGWCLLLLMNLMILGCFGSLGSTLNYDTDLVYYVMDWLGVELGSHLQLGLGMVVD